MGAMKKNISRRKFIKNTGQGAGALLAASMAGTRTWAKPVEDEYSRIYMTNGKGPTDNMSNLLELMGGIENIIGPNDVVVIKTNAQRINQGSGNLASIKTFIDKILDIPGFNGEIILGDNNHRWPAQDKGAWAEPFLINSNIPAVKNLNDLLALIQAGGHDNVTRFIWNDSYEDGGQRIYGPEDGEGYVFEEDNVVSNNAENADDYRETIMTYPIFKSTYSGLTIDLKNGVWKNGQYLSDKPLKFIIFSGLCRHSYYVGTTSAVKNYMGVVDLSWGSNPENGKLVDNYYNFHAFAFNENLVGPIPGVLGDAIGTFMRTIRKADMHFTTAEWIGWGSREDIDKAEQAGYLFASSDPVALDYYATKYILYPAAVRNNDLHKEAMNVDDPESAVRQYLEHCQQQGIGTLDESLMIINDPTSDVDSIEFEIQIFDNKPGLRWTVDQENDYLGFEIQRKDINSDFTEIQYIQVVSGKQTYEYTDEKVNSDGTLEYRIKLFEKNGNTRFSNVLTADVKLADKFILHPNYPNPFNSNTVLSYYLPHNGRVSLSIFNINGKLVKPLVKETQNAGFYSSQWDGTNVFGKTVSSGTFFAVLEFDESVQTRSLLYIK